MSEAPKDECWCSKNDDGRCVACAERLSQMIFQMGDSLLRIPMMAQALCRPCKRANGDWAAAKALRQLSEVHPDILDVEGATALVNNFVAASGITKTPLLDAEVRRIATLKRSPGAEDA